MKKRDPVDASKQLRRYLLGSFHVLILFLPLALGLSVVHLGVDAAGIVFLTAFTAHCIIASVTLQRTVDSEVNRTDLSAWVMPLLAVSTTLSVILALYWTYEKPLAVWPAATVLILAGTVLGPLLSTARIVLVSFLIAVLLSVAVWGEGGLDSMQPFARVTTIALAVGVPIFIVALILIGTSRWSLVLLKAVKDQAQMDHMRADLAVAEERLRIARDMHDVMGRTLTAVALKSDLAGALTQTGATERALEEVYAVRDLANESLAELRGVLAGYRKPSLAAELVGAQSLLRSAGVESRIMGETTEIPSWAGEPLSWVLREAATNIVRHANAKKAVFVITVEPQSVSLTVSNDGLINRPAFDDGHGDGSGLVGLTERLKAVGGTLDYGVVADRFTVVAKILGPALGGEKEG